MKQWFLLCLMLGIGVEVGAGTTYRWAKTKKVDGVVVYERAMAQDGQLTVTRSVGDVSTTASYAYDPQLPGDSAFTILHAAWVCREIFDYTNLVNWESDGTGANRINIGYAMEKCAQAQRLFLSGQCAEQAQLVAAFRAALAQARNMRVYSEQIKATEQAVEQFKSLRELQPCGYLLPIK